MGDMAVPDFRNLIRLPVNNVFLSLSIDEPSFNRVEVYSASWIFMVRKGATVSDWPIC